jgi:chemotaxis protein methyltransferase CheR
VTLPSTEINDDRAPGVSERAVTLSDKDFLRLKEFIYRECGIKITEAKRTMLEARLQKRLRNLKLSGFSQYCDFLFSPRGMGEEMVSMIDVVTTNKTDFFREPGHFDYLTLRALPDLIRSGGGRRSITAWSAGCSSGEEPYTLAMVMAEFAEKGRRIDYTIIATDISTRVLEKAKLAVYDEDQIDPIPAEFRRKYLLKSKKPDDRSYRIVPELRERVRFGRLNFMEGNFGFRETMDFIFCRNVIIYFDKSTQERLLNRFCECLSPDGFFFMGHSETLLGMNVPLTQVAPTVYRKAMR